MGTVRTLAHLSDLHFGTDERAAASAAGLVRSVLATGVDHVVVTGDVTHRGLWREYDTFERTFAPLRREGRLTVVPGNHDRTGDDVAEAIMDGSRVRAWSRDGLYIVGMDSTGPHNRYLFAGHGMATQSDLAELDAALAEAPEGDLVVVCMHHHPLPLPEETGLEQLSRMLGLPYAAELGEGERLLAICRGRADLLLHGHRHVPVVLDSSGADGSTLPVINAGSSTELGCARVFTHAHGVVRGRDWLHASRPAWPSVGVVSALQGDDAGAYGLV